MKCPFKSITYRGGTTLGECEPDCALRVEEMDRPERVSCAFTLNALGKADECYFVPSALARNRRQQ